MTKLNALQSQEVKNITNITILKHIFSKYLLELSLAVYVMLFLF